MNTDGNTAAINRHLAEQEAYDAANAPPICDECGEEEPLAETYDDSALSFGASHMICKACYEAPPEPDTGRPDWEDLL
jgi:hypothetical protein